MPSVDELLNIAEVVAKGLTETNDVIEIDADTRTMIIPDTERIFGVMSDEKGERKYFRCKRFVGNGIDLSKLDLRVIYQNASGLETGRDKYIVTDLATDGEDYVTFSWELSRKVTAYKGIISFIVCAIKTRTDGIITNEWNTTLANGVVLDGLEVSGTQEQEEEAHDYYKQLEAELLRVANEQKAAIETKAQEVIKTIPNDYTQMQNDVSKLKEHKVDKTEFMSTMQTVFANIADIRAYLGITADDIVGIQVDYKNKTFKRLAGAANLTKGSDFDKFTMFGGRKRCNVADDGSIVAWYGDADYKEDGSMGQVMVYQPKFYYLVCPVEYDPIDTGIGYHLRKANYYVSEKPRAGFRLHPAFYDASGNEIDYFLTSAYEGSIYDASASAYLLNDEQVMNTGEDKFSSIAGARPASGSSQNLTRPNIEAMAQNRGTNWHGDLIKQVSAEQMLMIIEMGMMNLQTAIAQGVVSLPWTTGSDTTSSYAAATGSTASLGNGTGRAEKTTTYEGGVAKEYTVDGKTSVCWRGKENFWGNIWKFVYGINIWGNGKMGGGQPYICSDFSFAESKNSGNYEPAGFTVTNANGYISAMGYSTACDWLFIASECLGNSSLPVGDYTYITVNLNGYRIAHFGGRWNGGGDEGSFYWALDSSVGTRTRSIGGRLVYIPTRDSATYTAAIEAWKQKMAV
nr:MAG TPA: tail collar fiber protein [Caudoviricetes sp.]